MSARKWLVAALATLLVIGLIGGGYLALRAAFFAPTKITAFFPTATAVYPGDDVRVSGVKVGTIDSIEPQGTRTKMTITVDHGVPVPADAKAVIVAQNLVAARYVQLTPAFRGNGPKMADGAVIPQDRTGVPVEWDDVKKQLERLATDLNPNGDMSTSSVGRFIDSAANALDGNGDKLRQTLAELSGVGRIFAEGSGNFVGIVKNLQVFVTALKNSNEQIVSFNDRLATLSSVLDGSRSDLDAALTDLSTAVTELKRFVAGTRNQTAEMAHYLNFALDKGVKPSEVSEIVTHLAFYAGWGNAMDAVAVIKEVFATRKIAADQLPPASPKLLALNEAAEADRAKRVGDLFGAAFPGVTQYTTDVLFRDLWLRPGLASRDRSLVTISSLVASGQAAQLTGHVNIGMNNGLTQVEIAEALTHLAFYVGWPNVFSAMPIAKDVFEKRPR